jgi:hypothetical protein
MRKWRSLGAPSSDIAWMVLDDYHLALDEDDVWKLLTGFNDLR